MYLLELSIVFYFVPVQNHPPTTKVFYQTYRYVYLALDSTYKNIKIALDDLRLPVAWQITAEMDNKKLLACTFHSLEALLGCRLKQRNLLGLKSVFLWPLSEVEFCSSSRYMSLCLFKCRPRLNCGIS